MLHETWAAIGGDKARFLPQSASTGTASADQLSLFLFCLSAVITFGILTALVWFAVKFRRRPGNEIAREVKVHYPLEIAWSAIPLLITLFTFAWGARQYLWLMNPPPDAETVLVVGKQWMWKFEHPSGVSEINNLHLPVGRPVQFLMISQDVIHSFFVPDFRSKYDVLPGRYTREWFTPTVSGTYRLLCTQYCGTDHSEMQGWVTVLSIEDYQKWEAAQIKPGVLTKSEKGPLSSRGASHIALESSFEQGRELYYKRGCASCHDGEVAIGPPLDHLLGRTVSFNDGSSLIRDENYLRESILSPQAHVVRGYQGVMPTFAGQLKEEEIFDLIRYLSAKPESKRILKEALTERVQ